VNMAHAPMNSTLIRHYVKASQQIDMQIEVDRQAKITNITKKREVKGNTSDKQKMTAARTLSKISTNTNYPGSSCL